MSGPLARKTNALRRAPDSLSARGFTLIEMIMVIVLMGIIGAVLSRIIAKPIQGYLDSGRRAALVTAADTALNRMTREIRLALPNSVRVSGGNAIEFLRIRAGGRYRAEGVNALDFNAPNGSFDVLGAFDWGQVEAGTFPANCTGAMGKAGCLVIYNTGQTGADAYQGDNIADITAAATPSITFNRASKFPLASSSQRFYAIDGPVSFVCDLGAGDVRRYDGYPIPMNQAPGPPPGGTSALLVDKVSGCTFTYAAGTATRGGLATLEITLTDSGESIALVQQVHVSNVP